MATKVRKQIYIEPAQEQMLKQLSETLQVSEAEIIRQAIDTQLRTFRPRRRSRRAWENERKRIEQLIAQGPVPGRRKWRREDLYDRHDSR